MKNAALLMCLVFVGLIALGAETVSSSSETLSAWLEKGNGLFPDPLASGERLLWCKNPAKAGAPYLYDWNGDGVPDVEIFHFVEDCVGEASRWVVAFTPLADTSRAPLIVVFWFNSNASSPVRYDGYLWNGNEFDALYGKNAPTISRGTSGKLFLQDSRVLSWMTSTFGITKAAAHNFLPHYFWQSRQFVIKYLP